MFSSTEVYGGSAIKFPIAVNNNLSSYIAIEYLFLSKFYKWINALIFLYS